MTEWKLFDDDVAHVSTAEFHKDRERAPHWEQDIHRGRLVAAAALVLDSRREVWGIRRGEPTSDPVRIVSVVDLGCGDGGLVAHLNTEHRDTIAACGFDFQPSNVAGWEERGIEYCTFGIDFVAQWDIIPMADVYVITECLEHLTDPHEMVRRIRARGAQIVCSSPWTEHAGSHDECHAWAWDPDGYRAMIETAGFKIRGHDRIGMFQLIWAVPR